MHASLVSKMAQTYRSIQIHQSPTISLVCDTKFLHFIQLDQMNKVKEGKEVIIYVDIKSKFSL